MMLQDPKAIIQPFHTFFHSSKLSTLESISSNHAYNTFHSGNQSSHNPQHWQSTMHQDHEGALLSPPIDFTGPVDVIDMLMRTLIKIQFSFYGRRENDPDPDVGVSS